MNEQLEKAYNELKKDIDYVHMKWVVYKQLYGQEKERHDLLNEMAPGFFAIVHDSLFSDILLSIGRLTDPVVQGKYNNLSLEKIVSLLDEEVEREVSQAVHEAYDRFKILSSDIRKIRDKRLAHADAKTRLVEDALPSMTRQKVEDALEPARVLMNALENHFYDSQRVYDMPIIHGSGDILIKHLKWAKEHKECRRKARLSL